MTVAGWSDKDRALIRELLAEHRDMHGDPFRDFADETIGLIDEEDLSLRSTGSDPAS